MKILYWLAIPLIAIGAAKAEEPLHPTNASNAELEIALDPLSTPNTLRLSAWNRGASSFQVVRPRARMIDRFDSWGGWSLRVQGPDGAFHPFPFPGGIPPVTSLDLVELRPDESIGVVLDLSRFTRDGKSTLADLPGKYAVVVSYHLEQDKILAADGGDFVSVSKVSPVESAALQFTVKHP